MSMKRVRDLVAGDMLDLENDKYADYAPCSCEQLTGELCEQRDDDGHQLHWKYEYGIVDEMGQETAECVRIDFTNGQSVGFPPEHMVRLGQT